MVAVVVVAAALQRWGNGLGERWDEVRWSRGGGLDVAADADAGDSETEETRRCVQGRRRKGGSAAGGGGAVQKSTRCAAGTGK